MRIDTEDINNKRDDMEEDLEEDGGIEDKIKAVSAC